MTVCHNSSEIILICWFGAQETFLIIINVRNWWAAHLWNSELLNQDPLNRKLKKAAFILNAKTKKCMKC